MSFCQYPIITYSDQKKIFFFIIGFNIATFFIVIGCRYLNFTNDILRIVLCSAVLLKTAERIFQHSACHRISLKIDGTSELVEHSMTIMFL